MEDLSKTLNRDKENIKKTQSEIKNFTEIKNTLNGINSRLQEAEEQICDLEDRVMERIKTQGERKKIQNENRFRGLGNTIKHNNTHIIGIPEGEEQEMGAENLL